MYVEYLDKLLADIERHRKHETRGGDNEAAAAVATETASNEVTSSMNDENKRRSNCVEIDDLKRSSLHLDIEAASKVVDKNDDESSTPFVTVISVSSPTTAANVLKSDVKFQNLTFTKKKVSLEADGDVIGGSLKLNRTSKLPPATQPRVRSSKSRESLNSVSSPTTPTSPLISSTEDFGMSPREGLGIINSSISSSNESCKELEEEEQEVVEKKKVLAGKFKAVEEVRKKAAERSLTAPVMSMTGSLDKGFKHRGRPDGREFEDEDGAGQKTNPVDRSVSNGSDVSSKANKVRELMANWEMNRPTAAAPIAKPERRSRLGSGASSAGVKSRDMSPVIGGGNSRARMGSPSGKSHDSSDSETGWIRRGSSGGGISEVSPGSTRRVSGETRLDRLVRRPSGEKSAPPLPPPNKPVKKPQAKPRQFFPVSSGNPDHVYDTVAPEPEEAAHEDEYYDNHLLYGRAHTSDTIGSGGGSSADLGFDEPPIMTAQPLLKSAQSGLSLTGSGTLSSSDTDGLSGSPSFGRENSTEDESNYVNIQYFLLRKEFPSSGTGQSDDELDAEDELEPIDEDEVLTTPLSATKMTPTSTLNATPTTMATRGRMPLPDASEAERLMMYKCILNSIVESEAIYLEGLSVMLQYMKAMKVTLATQQPVIPKEDFDVIFYKIPELHDLHFTFHESLKRQVDRYNGTDTIGHNFKMLASRMKIYAAFLNNYPKALEALHKCSAAYPQFADLTRSIKLRTVKGQKQGQSLSLEDLLHKPVARVQKHCLVLQVTDHLRRPSYSYQVLPLQCPVNLLVNNRKK